jgi:SHS2 domain-containing protein
MEQRVDMNKLRSSPAGHSPPPYEIVEHTADWAVRVRGENFTVLLHNAAVAMNMLLVGPETVTGREEVRRLSLSAYDRESMLVEWLGELAYLAETEGLIFSEYHFDEVTPEQVRVTITGGPAPVLHKHIKAVTYHNLEVLETENGLETTIVFDV